MTAKINGLLIQSLNVKRFFLFVNEIADNFTPGSYKVPENITQLRQEEYHAWCISRHIKPISDSEKNKILLFVDIKSLLSKQKLTSIASAFKLILPHPATQFNTICTCMKNVHDILKQRELPHGPL